jgi:hypothetical protein
MLVLAAAAPINATTMLEKSLIKIECPLNTLPLPKQ